jgi:hypothetical protein
MSTLLTFPTTDRGAQRPASLPEIGVTRQSIRRCADWQATIAEECRRQRTLNPRVFEFLKTSGLLERCTFLATDEPGGRLRFKYIGAPTLAKLGRAWGRSMLNHPLDESPHAEFSASVDAQYGDAIASGDLVLNRIDVHGIGQPFAYTHLLVGWEDKGRRAVLSAIDLGA